MKLTRERPRKPDYADLLDVVDRRKIPYFLHYTPVKNLSSILQHGILSRKQMQLRDIQPVLYHGWGKKWTALDDYICLSLIPPKRMIEKTKETQAVLLIQPSVIGQEKTYFSPINSAKEAIDVEEIFSRDSMEAFEDLFRYEEGTQLRNDFAEILVKDYIAVSDITGICFQSWNGNWQIVSKLWVKGILGRSPRVRTIPHLF